MSVYDATAEESVPAVGEGSENFGLASSDRLDLGSRRAVFHGEVDSVAHILIGNLVKLCVLDIRHTRYPPSG
ncbi:MAG: hypothetical protein ABI382_11110 [Nakamurella sp.]